MADIIRCPSCQRQLQVPENFAGQKVQCPKCATTFVAAGPGAALPAVAHDAVEPPPPDWEPPRHTSGRPYDDYDDDDYDDDGDRYARRDYLPHRGTAVLTLGILSLLVCWPVLGPIAWIMGNSDLKEIRAGRMDPEGESYTNAGRICGIVATCVGYGVVCVWLMFLFSAAGAGGIFR
jgi:hypothetical protein